MEQTDQADLEDPSPVKVTRKKAKKEPEPDVQIPPSKKPAKKGATKESDADVQITPPEMPTKRRGKKEPEPTVQEPSVEKAVKKRGQKVSEPAVQNGPSNPSSSVSISSLLIGRAELMTKPRRLVVVKGRLNRSSKLFLLGILPRRGQRRREARRKRNLLFRMVLPSLRHL